MMPLELKNAGATHQRTMNIVSPRVHTQDRRVLHRRYSVKSRDKGDHIADLKRVFDIMRVYQLKMNLTKSFLGVASGKFLGFVITSKGIRHDPEKVRAIQEMP